MSPSRPKRPCARPGCSNFQPCPVHGKRPSEYGRETAARRGYDARHRRWRTMVLARHPLCCACETAPSTVADHIVPLPRPNWWDGDWSIENGQGLCASCHSAKTRRENATR